LFVLLALQLSVSADEQSNGEIEELPEGLFEFLGETEVADEMWLDAELWADAMQELNGSVGDE